MEAFYILLAFICGVGQGCILFIIVMFKKCFTEIEHNMESFRKELCFSLEEIYEKHYVAMHEGSADNE